MTTSGLLLAVGLLCSLFGDSHQAQKNFYLQLRIVTSPGREEVGTKYLVIPEGPICFVQYEDATFGYKCIEDSLRPFVKDRTLIIREKEGTIEADVMKLSDDMTTEQAAAGAQLVSFPASWQLKQEKKCLIAKAFTIDSGGKALQHHVEIPTYKPLLRSVDPKQPSRYRLVYVPKSATTVDSYWKLLKSGVTFNKLSDVKPLLIPKLPSNENTILHKGLTVLSVTLSGEGLEVMEVHEVQEQDDLLAKAKKAKKGLAVVLVGTPKNKNLGFEVVDVQSVILNRPTVVCVILPGEGVRYVKKKSSSVITGGSSEAWGYFYEPKKGGAVWGTKLKASLKSGPENSKKIGTVSEPPEPEEDGEDNIESRL